MSQKLADLIAEGVPVFSFGSSELTALHDAAKDPPVYMGRRADGHYFYNDGWHARSSYPVSYQIYGWSHHGFRYIVNHGHFYTLQTIFRGQVVPASEDVVS